MNASEMYVPAQCMCIVGKPYITYRNRIKVAKLMIYTMCQKCENGYAAGSNGSWLNGSDRDSLMISNLLKKLFVIRKTCNVPSNHLHVYIEWSINDTALQVPSSYSQGSFAQ